MESLPRLRAVCSAPGKVILFGEHAVVYGHPAIAAAIDQRTVVEADCCGDRFTVNGYKVNPRFHSYLKTAMEVCWTRPDPVRLQTEGGVPSASGTGSSAALTVAAVGALRRLQGLDIAPLNGSGIGPAAGPALGELAQAAFRVERLTQGGGSPTDTSTATAGGGIAIAGADKAPGVGQRLWDLQWDDRAWTVERIDMPPLTLVVGNSGVKSKTGIEVAKVARNAKKNVVIRETLADIGDIARRSVPMLRARDWVGVGQLMDKAHGALHRIGVNHPAVQTLVDAARATPGTLGAKLTGAGGGGSMIALTDRPEAAAAAIAAAGGVSYVVRLGGPGVEWPVLPGDEEEAAALSAALPTVAEGSAAGHRVAGSAAGG